MRGVNDFQQGLGTYRSMIVQNLHKGPLAPVAK